MAWSNRERYMGIAVAAAFGLFALDHFVFSPYTAERERLSIEFNSASQKLAEDRHVLQKQRQARRDWAELQSGGLQSDPSEMERQMQHWLNGWAQESGLGNLSLRTDRTAAQHGGFVQVTVHAAGTGPVAAVAKLLWRMEAAPVPVRVNDVQINPAKEGSDQVQLQLNVSAVCTAGEGEPQAGGAGTGRPTSSRPTVTGERL